MQLRGTLHAEAPIYRGNARKTLFTRDGDGRQRLVSLAGEIDGTAQALMDAFIGQSRNGRNTGLLNRLWLRLYGRPMPDGLIGRAECRLQESSYPADRFFDLRMGMRLDEDRWAAEANANYKMETLLRHSVFDFTLQVNDNLLQRDDNGDKLHYLLAELSAGRFWFGAGKSKGLGRCRLEMETPFRPRSTPALRGDANHLTLSCLFDASNPLLVGWNWGKVDPDVPAFAAIEGKLLLDAMRTLPDPVRSRLEMTIGGPILNPEDWRRKLADYLPRATAIWLRAESASERESWTLPRAELEKLGKDKKFPLSQRIIDSVLPVCDLEFASQEEAEAAISQALGSRANMTKRIASVLVSQKRTGRSLDQATWRLAADSLGLDPSLGEQLAARIDDEGEFTAMLAQACAAILPGLNQQIDRQVRLMRSDNWVDVEIAVREQHIRIKEMLLDGRISERQWDNYNQAPDGVALATWREFLSSHQRVRYSHMLSGQNLRKSITNDANFIEFLQTYRERTRQELAQPVHTEFRAGGSAGRDIAVRYGKNYDTVFMRMLTWKPSESRSTAWEVYIPGGTLKGAFRKRASQILKTLWGDGERANRTLDWLFGRQGQVGRVFFSDAYLVDPENTASAWCSMDGIRVDPRTAQPDEGAKMSFLYAYGSQLQFRLRLDIQDITPGDLDALLVLQHLLQDFAQGDIPLGGAKTAGLGWVQAQVDQLQWHTARADGITARLFPGQALTPSGVWQSFSAEGEKAARLCSPTAPLSSTQNQNAAPPRTRDGYISHRSFGGYCGTLWVEAEILRPTHIKESGEPSYTAMVRAEQVSGWDFFSLSSPDQTLRDENRVYALPSRTLKGLLRHIYSIASDSKGNSRDLSNLHPADSLFGWVGAGANQALMGRLSVSFGLFDPSTNSGQRNPEMRWLKLPHFYGRWRFEQGRWVETETGKAKVTRIDDAWRIFPHTTVAPIVLSLPHFQPDTALDEYVRAVMPGSKARFHVRFWNLEEAELQRLIWALALEDNLAHKIGRHRYLGLGSLRFSILPESHLTDWGERYTSGSAEKGRLPLRPDEWRNVAVVSHLDELRAALKFA